MSQTGLNLDALKELVSASGRTPRSISLAITDGKNAYLIRDLLIKKTRNPRADTLSQIADHFNVPLDRLISPGVSGVVKQSSGEVEPRFLQLRYKVAAGVWFEPQFEEPPEETSLPVLPLPRYAAYSQWLEKVVGPSANKRFRDGSYVHVVDALEMGYRAKHNDWVVVVRERDQGAVRERTVKQVSVDDSGRVTLWPRSTDERFQEPIDYLAGARPGDDDVWVQLVGKVVGSYDPVEDDLE